ncbi:diacylglycerol/lipid kinase family protein [Bacillus xiapuensis]|uniref:diacylglycerol/lipid kinase family protein n=1 Tax=Bacillus xiapuensis TaxID=2014075 RepID=UPI000C232F77|nr:diacylglycerol kinase family protein [Bacillus xiapuensis]
MYLVLVNPQAGKKQALKRWQQVERIFREKRVEYQLLKAQSAYEMREAFWQLEVKENIRAAVIIGGDGTVHAAIQELARKHIPIAVLPAGSGNDLARVFQLTTSPDLFVESLLKHEMRELDVLQVNGHYCLTVAGVGMDAEVSDRVNRSPYKKWLNVFKIGSLAYLASTLTVIRAFQPVQVNCRVDNDHYIAEKVWLLACGNTPSYGGGMKICPLAHPADGVMDIVLLHTVNRLAILTKLLPKVFSGKHLNKPGVTYLKGKEIYLTAQKPLKVMADGEAIGQTPVRIRVKERGIQFIMT